MARNVSARVGQRGGTVQRPLALAARLAEFARRLYTLVLTDLDGSGSARLTALYRQARLEIASSLAPADFADLLAQVLVYCSLLVDCSSQRRRETFIQAAPAFLDLSGLPPFVSRLLTTLWQDSEREQDELALCVRELLTFLREIDLPALLEKLSPASLQGNALVYFYEMFLTAYAPHQRSQHGVYYTPSPVIAYMVGAIDELLRRVFAYTGGLAEALQDGPLGRGVYLCDPACGTGAFLWAVLDHVSQVYRATTQADLRTSIQPRLIGCEIMPAAYLLARIELAVRQAKLERPAAEWTNREVTPARLSHGISARISLANSLVDVGPLANLPPASLPILLGNPPYAGHSLNQNTWLGSLLESYKTGDSGLKKPAQAKWLRDDYVQFLRLAQWQVEQAGRGIVAFLTSHSYLDNPTFRGMRLSLLRSFDEIYILDLHGNSKRRELAPDRIRDHNIFSIQQGIAIGIFVKRGDGQASTNRSSPRPALYTGSAHTAPGVQANRSEERLATVYHADIWGPRAVYKAGQLSGGKLGWLASHDLNNTPWQSSRPVAPFYLFTPRNNRHQAEYMANWSLPAIFSDNGDPAPGLVTCQDSFAISWTAEEAAGKIAALLATDDEAEARHLFRLCTQGQWDYLTARRALSSGLWRNALGRIHYRPFDTRWTVFERHVAVHLRERVTRHMRAGPNLALVVGRAGQVIDGGNAWDIVFCSRLPTEFNLYRRGGNYLFPLYLYPASGTTRVANLAVPFIAQICQRLSLNWLPDGAGDLLTTFGPDDIFAYIYALLYAPGYRLRYADFLKIDFPRVPLSTRVDLFRSLCMLGRALSRSHLLEQPLPDAPTWTRIESTLVDHVQYRADKHGGGRVSICSGQHLDGVSPDVWSLTIGGYQIARKWLWDRRGCHLSPDELTRYSQIIASLQHTLELMSTIDSTIEQYGGWPLP